MAKEKWVAPSYYKLVKDGVVPNDGKRYVLIQGSIYVVDIASPDYIKKQAARKERKAEKIRAKLERVATRAEKRAVKTLSKQYKAEKTAKRKEILAKINELKEQKKKL